MFKISILILIQFIDEYNLHKQSFGEFLQLLKI